MRKKILLILLALLAVCLCLASCDKNDKFEGQAKVTFDLQGGTYKNSSLPVYHYYKIGEGQATTIMELKSTNGEFKRAGYDFDGWYTNEKFTSSSRWNFETDTITSEGVTLYAKWNPKVTYSYELYYIDEDTHEKSELLDSYVVKQGEAFEDWRNCAYKRTGYTPIGFTDADGNPWDEDFVHPGGDEDCAIEVYVQYIKGVYSVVTTADELLSAKGNIYLMNDIDMDGAELDLTSFTSGVFEGNNKKISNFKLPSTIMNPQNMVADIGDENATGRDTLCVSLFGMLDGATINNLTIEGMTIDIRTINDFRLKHIYVAPLSCKITDSTINNVNISYDYKVSKLPDGFDEDNLVIATDKLYNLIDNPDSVSSDSSASGTLSDAAVTE